MKYTSKLQLLLVSLVLQSSIISVTQAQLEIDPNLTIEVTGHNVSKVTIIDIETLYNQVSKAIINENNATTRKQPCNNTSTILAGLAQSFFQLGQAVVAPTEKEQQQAVLNIVGTALNVAAHLAHHRPREEKEKNNKPNEEVTKALIDLTLRLLDEIEKEQLRSPNEELPETLDQIQKAKNYKEKISLIMNLLSAAKTARKYLTDLLEGVQYFLENKVAPLGESVRKVLAYYLDPYSYEEEEKSEGNIDNPSLPETKSIRLIIGDNKNQPVIEVHGFEHVLKKEIKSWVTYLQQKLFEHYQVD